MTAETQTRWSALVAFLVEEEDASPLAWVRILACTTLSAHALLFFFSGAAELSLVHHTHGGLGSSHGWLEPLGGASPGKVSALVLFTAAAGVLGALGLFTRPALLACWLSLRAITSLNPDARGSYDILLAHILFLLVLSGAGNALSLDARRRGGPRPAARWPRLLLVLQLGLLYFGSGLGKVSSGWIPGGDASALWFILQQPTWARFPDLPLWLYPVTQVATTVVWCFEILGLSIVLAVLLREVGASGWLGRFFRRSRWVEIYLAIGLAMHIGIEATMEVGPFCYASVALYPAALDPRRVAGWTEGVRARFGRSKATARAPDGR